MGRREKEKKINMSKILIVILIVLLIVAGVLFALKVMNNKNEIGVSEGNVIEENIIPVVVEEPQVKIYSGTDRPIAVMYDNVGDAVPQVNLNKAYITYEIIVEGGLTRLMPVFKGVDLDLIGPVRSSRHYFLDYALENDAIYVHHGWSPQAQSAIGKLGINNINGLYDSCFWRTKEKAAPHNSVTSSEKLATTIEKKGYRTTSDKKSILNYVAKEFDLESETLANSVTIKYSSYQTTSYEYDAENKVYLRHSNGKQQLDWKTDEPVQTKNIIVTFATNTPLNDGSGKDRQDLDNIGSLNGFYITNGKAIDITCEKKSQKEQTVYKDLAGNEIKVNDGNTFIQICPVDAEFTLE